MPTTRTNWNNPHLTVSTRQGKHDRPSEAESDHPRMGHWMKLISRVLSICSLIVHQLFFAMFLVLFTRKSIRNWLFVSPAVESRPPFNKAFTLHQHHTNSSNVKKGTNLKTKLVLRSLFLKHSWMMENHWTWTWLARGCLAISDRSTGQHTWPRPVYNRINLSSPVKLAWLNSPFLFLFLGATYRKWCALERMDSERVEWWMESRSWRERATME